jgi:hypothetical protein
MVKVVHTMLGETVITIQAADFCMFSTKNKGQAMELIIKRRAYDEMMEKKP